MSATPTGIRVRFSVSVWSARPPALTCASEAPRVAERASLAVSGAAAVAPEGGLPPSRASRLAQLGSRGPAQEPCHQSRSSKLPRSTPRSRCRAALPLTYAASTPHSCSCTNRQLGVSKQLASGGRKWMGTCTASWHSEGSRSPPVVSQALSFVEAVPRSNRIGFITRMSNSSPGIWKISTSSGLDPSPTIRTSRRCSR